MGCRDNSVIETSGEPLRDGQKPVRVYGRTRPARRPELFTLMSIFNHRVYNIL